MRRLCRDREGLSADLQGISQRARGFRIVRGIEGEHDVVRRERVSIGKHHALAEMQRVFPPVGGDGPPVGEPRFHGLRELVDPHQRRLREVVHESGRVRVS